MPPNSLKEDIAFFKFTAKLIIALVIILAGVIVGATTATLDDLI